MKAARGNGPRRRVRVWWGTPCEDGRNLLWAFYADGGVAEGYRGFMGRLYPGLAVTIDNAVTDDLEPLPGERSWATP